MKREGAHIERAVEVVFWMQARRRPPHWREVVDRLGVTRATAYRWLRAYAEVAERHGGPRWNAGNHT